MPPVEVMDPVLYCQQSLLQEDQPGGAGNSTVSACTLKNDRHLPAQQHAGAARDFFMQRGEQLRSSCGNVAPQDEQFGIEHVEKTYQSGGERLESEVQHAACTGVAVRCCLKDRLGAGSSAGIVDG